MHFREAVSQLVGAVYEEALLGARWTGIANEMARLFDARIVALQPRVGEGSHGPELGGFIMAHDGVCCVDDDDSDPLMQEARRRPRGALVVKRWIGRDPVLGHTRYYRDRIRGVVEHALLTITLPTQGASSYLFLSRLPSQSPFSAGEVAAFGLIARHFGHAAGIAARRGRFEALGLDAAFGGCAIFRLTAAGRVVDCNTTAVDLLNADSRIRLRNGALSLPGAMNVDAIVAHLACGEGAAGGPPLFLSIPEAAPSGALIGMAFVQPSGLDPAPPERIVLVLGRPARSAALPAEALKKTFGLTEAEARCALTFLETASIAAVAEELGITVETGRYYFKKLFAKTGTRSQPELMRLLLRHPAADYARLAMLS